MQQPGVVRGRKFCSEFFRHHFEHFWGFSDIVLSIFGHISGSIGPITLIWASLERSFPPAYRWCQSWSKVMTLEVEERPKLVTTRYGRHGSQWVKLRANWRTILLSVKHGPILVCLDKQYKLINVFSGLNVVSDFKCCSSYILYIL